MRDIEGSAGKTIVGERGQVLVDLDPIFEAIGIQLGGSTKLIQ